MPPMANNVNTEAIPSDLIARRQWCRWKHRNGTKLPIAFDGTVFRSNDSETWCRFDQIEHFDAIAFVISEDDPYTGIDLDGCIVDGEFVDWSHPILDRFRGIAYCEISPSGQGVKLLTRATKPEGSRCKSAKFGEGKQQVECYDSVRFWTMTGNVVEGFEVIEDGQEAVDWLCETYLSGGTRQTGTKRESSGTGAPQTLIERAQRYADKCDPASKGNLRDSAFSISGNLHAFIGEHGERLTDNEVYLLLRTWNAKNSEPLRDDELREASVNGRKNGTPPADKPPKQLGSVTASDKTPTTPGNNGVLSPSGKSGARKPAIPELHEFQPFPTDSLPAPLNEFVRQAAKSICCDESFVAMPLLAGAASAIGNSYGLLIKRGWVVPSILWTVVVAESGSGKSSPQRLALRPIHERQKRLLKDYDKEYAEFEKQHEVYMRDLADFKKSKDATREPPTQPDEPVCPRVVCNDTTIEALAKRLKDNPRGVICANDELAGWFGGFNRYKSGKGGEESKWLEFSNAQTSIIDRASSPRPLVIEKASVSVVGTIQPGILRKHLTAEHKASGMAARLLFAMPPRMMKRWTEDEIDESVEDAVTDIFDSLFRLEMRVTDDGSLDTNLIRLDSNAKQMFIGFYNRHNKEQHQLDGDLFAAFSKLEEYAARFALIIHCVRYATGEVQNLTQMDMESMEKGIELCQWFKQEAKRVYAVLSESELSAENRKLVNWIIANGGSTTPREFHRAHKATLLDTNAAETLLQQFVEAELGRWETVPTTEAGGRPSRKFTLALQGQNPINSKDSGGFVTSSDETPVKTEVLGERWDP